MEIVEIDPRKCYNCGKIFKLIKDLDRHKKRKTPCLIRDVAPENILNPLRCIFCNKIFAQKQTLTRHYKICKIKNGGMSILDEKIQYEQKIRILEEKDKQKDTQINELRAQMQQMQDQMKQLAGAPKTINNYINNGTINNIQLNNYNQPNVDSLRLTQDDLLVENIIKKVIELVYFSKDYPANHALYMPNIKESRLLVYRGGAWETVVGESLKHVLNDVKNQAFIIGNDKINGGDLYKTDEEFNKLYPVVRDAIRDFNMHGHHTKCNDYEIMELAMSKRDVIKKSYQARATAGLI